MRKFLLMSKVTLFCLLCSFSLESFGSNPGITARSKDKPKSGKYVDVPVKGRVTGEDGAGLPGVSVVVKGTTIGTVTDADGNYSLNVPNENSVLTYSFIGYLSQDVTVGTQSSINVSMALDITSIEEVVVTGYTTEKKKDIIGSVAVVSPKELLVTPAANLQSQLQGRAPGVSVSTSGDPGAGAQIRIRGFQSFGNNNPLYVIDGVPTEDPSRINPQDIESMQVLKDATSASIYGSRAINGVVIITTKQGKTGTAKINVDSYYGMQVLNANRFPKLLNTEEYGRYHFLQYQNDKKSVQGTIFGTGPAPVVPTYLATNIGGTETNPLDANPDLYSLDPNLAPYTVMRTSAGTDWHKEITRPARIQSHQLSATGGMEKGTYALGFNYFEQEGTFIHTGYKRGTVRANTMFNPIKSIRVGENVQVSYIDRNGGDQRGDGGAWAQAFRMVPYVPVRDIKGNWGGNNIPESGNGTNPVADLTRNANDRTYGWGLLGNAYAEVDFLKFLTGRTSFGIDYGNNYNQDLTITTYERKENQATSFYRERYDWNLDWTWSNTLRFDQTFGEHNLKLLAGTEAIKHQQRVLSAQTSGFDVQTPQFMSLSTGLTSSPIVSNEINPNGWPNTQVATLFSIFGRLDYTFKDKYLFNATVRRDGSSRFSPAKRYAIFPAVGLGWRISEESFLKDITAISDLKIRAGWGQMGGQRNVNPFNSYNIFDGSNKSLSWYSLTGADNSAVMGLRQVRRRNLETQWETSETLNGGVDASLFGGKLDVTIDLYQTQTKGLLTDRIRINTEPIVGQPTINIGTMKNTGFDIGLGTRGNITSDLKYTAGITFTRYKNEVTKVGESDESFFSYGDRGGRQQNITRTQAGQPISSFYGYEVDGFYDDEAEVLTLDQLSGSNYSAAVGRWKFKDQNGDGVINDEDRVFTGSPIPDFQMGINLSLAYKGLDFTTFLFWNYGNEIYNQTKFFTHLRGFPGGVSKDVLTDSWMPGEDNADAKIPMVSSDPGGVAAIPTDFYIESGSYFRARTMQLGYTVPNSITSRIKVENFRIYIQGQNLFTITEYSGADPDVNLQNVDFNDRNMGVDQAGYPNSRQFIIGVNLGF